MLLHVEPVVLKVPGGMVRLEPLRAAHGPDLMRNCNDDSVWQFAVERPGTLEEMLRFIERAQAYERSGAELAFAIVEEASGQAIGSTRYLEIVAAHDCLEIGWTWIGVPWQRTACNTLCKYLLLRHAFEVMRAVRVQFKADARNMRSRAAIERIGGVYEGTLRKHRRMASGYVRDSAYYSVIADEWANVKARLEGMLDARK